MKNFEGGGGCHILFFLFYKPLKGRFMWYCIYKLYFLKIYIKVYFESLRW